MVSMLKESVPSFLTVHRWFLEFKRDCLNVKVERRSGTPQIAHNNTNNLLKCLCILCKSVSADYNNSTKTQTKSNLFASSEFF